MILLAAHLYLAGALAVYLYIDEAVSGQQRSVVFFTLAVVLWPILIPGLLVCSLIHEIIKVWQRRAAR